MNERIYLDNAAATRTDPAVVEAMLPFFTETYAVASSQFSHSPGIEAREALDRARSIIAKKLNASDGEIVFTSGGTESANLAIKGAAWAAKGKKNHIVCSRIEHQAVLHTCQWLAKEGFELTLLDVDSEGFVDLNRLSDSITDKTVLVSVQHANQEVGTIQPIREIGRLCKEKGTLFHTDASLTFGQLELDVEDVSADLVTISSNKMHGPKGMGALYVRKGTPVVKLLHGGYHEFDLRPGTENVTGAVGFGKAAELTSPVHTEFIRGLQGRLFDKLKSEIEGVIVNGPTDLSRRLPSNVNASFESVEGESVVLHLDMKGVAVITGSACFSRSLEPSYVMMAMGYSHERAHGSIRFTLSRFNAMEEMDRVASAVKDVVAALRRISPLTK
jgi:cysteine desulfurase